MDDIRLGGAFNASEECGKSEPPGCGVIFQLNPAGKEKVLHTFSGPTPARKVVRRNIFCGRCDQDRRRNLYGTTVFGGSCNDAGMIFKLTPSGRKPNYMLHWRSGRCKSMGWLIQDSSGNLYGTASGGW